MSAFYATKAMPFGGLTEPVTELYGEPQGLPGDGQLAGRTYSAGWRRSMDAAGTRS